MAIVYKCKHCGSEIGRLPDQAADSAMLGLDVLSVEEKQEMIEYQENGEIQVKAICESCEATLGEHPEYHELDYFIQ